MAIIEGVPGIEVYITVNGVNLHEYQDAGHDDDPRTKTVYIESRSDQLFGIRCVVKKHTFWKGDAFLLTATFDGTETLSLCFVLKSDLSYTDKIITNDHAVSARNKIKKFRFSVIQLSDEYEASTTLSEEFGTITVKVYHAVLGNIVPLAIYKLQNSTPQKSPIVFSEKALKGRALSHSVATTVEKGTTGRVQQKYTVLDDVEHPHATFVFKYGSIKALKSMLIVPRSPSPPSTSLAEERDAASLSLDEIRALQRFKISQNKVKTEAKREISDDDCPRSRKAARHSKHKVQIELDDDGEICKVTELEPDNGFRDSQVVELD